MIITLDGPCGSGKSTLARLLAKKLGFFYINSGYLYRACAYLLVYECKYTVAHLQSVQAKDLDNIMHQDHLIYDYHHGIVHIIFKGRDITHFLKSTLISDYASQISSQFIVRQAIVALQQKLGSIHDVITDGRDGGTEIYPQADYKFYIIAEPAIRAQRLQSDAIRSGDQLNFEQALHMTLMRDDRDMNRQISPLKQAKDAIVIDTSSKSIQDTLNFMLSIIV